MKPLDGIKVVDLSTYVAASSCGRMMADWGADVIKVESPSGDGYRNFGRAYKCPIDEDCNPLFDSLNANKRGMILDLKTSDGLSIMNKMLKTADVFLTNTRNQSLKPLGLDYETLMRKYPRLIIANLSAYGEKGSEVNRPGYDTMSLWTRCGFTSDISLINEGHYAPTLPLMGAGDIPVAMGLMAAINAALLAREKTGRGDRVALSLMGTGLWMGSQMIQSTQFGHTYPKNRFTQSPVGAAYECSDGVWFNCNVVNFPKDYPNFLKLMGHTELLDDPLYNNRPSMNRPEVSERLYKLFAVEFKKHPAAWWKEQFELNDLCYEVVGTFKGALEDPTAWENDFLYKMKHDNGTESILVRPSMTSVNLGLSEYNRAPKLGEHTHEVLAEYGYTEDQINAFYMSGAAKQREKLF